MQGKSNYETGSEQGKLRLVNNPRLLRTKRLKVVKISWKIIGTYQKAMEYVLHCGSSYLSIKSQFQSRPQEMILRNIDILSFHNCCNTAS